MGVLASYSLALTSTFTVETVQGRTMGSSPAIRVYFIPNLSGITSVIVRLNDNLGDNGDVLVGITLHGMTSNRVRIGIGHIGGGPPDDVSVVQPTPELGDGASLHGKQVFPFDNGWNQDISNSPVDPNSDNLIAGMGLNTSLHPDFGTVWNGAPNGIPYIVVAGTQTLVPIGFTAFGSQSDPGPYPVPSSASIEGGPSGTGDRHVLVIDRDNWKLYEMYRAVSHQQRCELERRLRRDLRSEFKRAASRRLDIRRRGWSANLSGTRALRRGV